MTHSGNFYHSLAVRNRCDLFWTANGSYQYGRSLLMLPELLAWEDCSSLLTEVSTLRFGNSLRQIQSLFVFLRQHHPSLGSSMQQLFQDLSPGAQAHFMLAPETAYWLRHFLRLPVEATSSLCRFLNAEYLADSGCGKSSKPSWTALGDIYIGELKEVSGKDSQEVDADLDPSDTSSFRAPLIATHIPIDFASPNVLHACETTIAGDVSSYSIGERAAIHRLLLEVFTLIEDTCPPAAALIREFVRVIIPLKMSGGFGSTSERSFPGRVIFRGIENVPIERAVNGLIHEAIHQYLYILELQGRFVIAEPLERVSSLWTGRPLELHSYLHACFVWYGLANFWTKVSGNTAFNAGASAFALDKCMKGFVGENPIDVLRAFPGAVRGDVLEIAESLQGRLVLAKAEVEMSSAA